MKNIFSKMFVLLTPSERTNLLILMAFMTATALVEVLGIASVAPMLAIITNPQSVETYPVVEKIYNEFGFSNFQYFSIAMGFGIFIIIALSNAMTLGTLYLSYRYANNREYTIGWNLLKTYMFQPYKFFIETHSTVLLRNVDNEVAYIISNVLSQSLVLVAKAISSLAILILIFFVNPAVTMVIGLILGSAYVISYLLIRKQMFSLGVERMELSAKKLKTITDSIRIIKDVKMFGAEEMFLDKFRDLGVRYSHVRTVSDTLGVAPRYFVEIFAIAALVFAIIYIVAAQDNPAKVLPILGVYAFAGYRLMPALQQIFGALSRIQFSIESLNLISSEVETLAKEIEIKHAQDTQPLRMQKSFGLRNASYVYDNGTVAVQDIDLTIHKGERIGLIGGSGAGKSTMIDLLVGLNMPTSGKLIVDDVEVDKRSLSGWRSDIGYVSQQVYILDESIDVNITLERNHTLVDQSRLACARSHALINEFSTNADRVGEDGTGLSGGQRQRIGIARALYRDADILVFDEATSALDAMTERRILDQLCQDSERTMIFVSHRVETLKFCDRIYILSGGGIVDFGSYNELLERSPFFVQLLHSQND